MPKKLTDEEYYASLPKKQVGTAVLFFDAEGRLLIVKPDYKDAWLVPGGSVDDGESPLACARREVREEIGLETGSLELIGVYYSPAQGLHPDSLKFIFAGGMLDRDRIGRITLDRDELEEFKFLSPADAIPLLSGSLRASIPAALEAAQRGTVAYVEKS